MGTYGAGSIAIANATGQELVEVDNGGAVKVHLTTQQIADLASEEGNQTETAITTVGNGTLTAAGLVGGQIARTGPTAPVTDTLATAAQIVAALPSFILGATFNVRIKNGTVFTDTLAAPGGGNITLPANMTIPPFSAWSAFGTLGGTAAAPTITFTHVSTAPLYGTLDGPPQVLAAAGQTQGSATVITSSLAIVTALATATHNGVILPIATTGVRVRVASGVSGGFKVYPGTNCRIGTGATNVADTNVASFKQNVYVAVNKTRWSVQRGA